MVNKRLISQIQQSLSKEPDIKLAYVLGSIVSGKARSDSDFDLSIVVDDKTKVKYEYIYNLISHLKFPKDLDLSIIDKSSSPIFLFQITGTGQCVYQKSQEEKISFEAFVMKNFYDTAYIRKIYYSYLKEKFPYVS